MANGKLYPGGVDIATPFEMNDPQPIVSYMVVDTIANRDLLPNQFDGMTTYVKETKLPYYKTEEGWKTSETSDPIEDYNYKQIVDDTILF